MDLQERTALYMREKFGIRETQTFKLFDNGMLSESGCKAALIRQEFKQGHITLNKTEHKAALADKYCVSFASVEKYLQCT